MTTATKRQENAARIWLSDFGTRCSATLKREEAEVRARDYAKGFSDMAPEVFCDAAREAAAMAFDFFPSYAALRKFLVQWWDDNKPRPPALPGAEDPSLTEEDRHHVASWQGRRNALQTEGTFAVVLSMYRRWPAVFRYILRTDAAAMRIARWRRWADDPADPKHGWDDAVAIGRSVLEIMRPLADGSLHPHVRIELALLRAAVARHAPENLPLIPADPPAPERGAAFAVERSDIAVARRELDAAYAAHALRTTPAVMPRPIDRETLDRIYDAQGIVVRPESPPATEGWRAPWND